MPQCWSGNHDDARTSCPVRRLSLAWHPVDPYRTGNTYLPALPGGASYLDSTDPHGGTVTDSSTPEEGLREALHEALGDFDDGYDPMQLMTSLPGITVVLACRRCAAVVADTDLHNAWHAQASAEPKEKP